MKKTLIALFATASVFAGVSAAQAADGNNSDARLTVTATYKPGCTINFDQAGGTYNLGTFSNLNNAFPENGIHGSFTYSCSNGYKGGADGVKLDLAGVDGPNTSGQRNLYTTTAGVSPSIPVNIYIGNTTSGTIWGDGTNGTKAITPNDSVSVNGRFDFTMQIPQFTAFVAGGNEAQYRNVFVATVAYTGNAAAGNQG